MRVGIVMDDQQTIKIRRLSALVTI
jgi:hypothetical protein